MIECKHKHPKVLLSFDVEEFDMPREHGGTISVEEGVEVSAEGVEKILDLLKRTAVLATFFVTGNFAERAPELVRIMVAEGHEVACHGVDHFRPKASDLAESKRIVEKLAGVKVRGYRQPRMFKTDYGEMHRCGYVYDSSVNPAWVPGRYNNTGVSRRPFVREGVVEVPTSVATGARVPMFWLALHWMPVLAYVKLARGCLRQTGYFATYFHPWEFATAVLKYKMVPGYVRHNAGDKMVKRLERVIRGLEGEFVTYSDFVERWQNEK